MCVSICVRLICLLPAVCIVLILIFLITTHRLQAQLFFVKFYFIFTCVRSIQHFSTSHFFIRKSAQRLPISCMSHVFSYNHVPSSCTR